jgi:hypothetical protein
MKKAAKSAVEATAVHRVKSSPNRHDPGELRDHYDFNYAKSRPNRFAGRFRQGSVAVVLDPDVAAVFQSAEAVNDLLRSVISAMATVDAPKTSKNRGG